MTKTTFFKTLLVALLLLTTSVSTWADTYSYTFAAKAWSAYDSQTLSSVSWTAAATGGGYWGYDAIKGQQFGSSSNPATALSLATTGISGTISSIKVNTAGASSIAGTVSVSVGGTAFTSGGSATPALTSTATDYTFTGTGTGNVVISWAQTSSKALYIKSIEIIYTTVVNAVPVVSAGSPAGTVGAVFTYNISATNTPTSYALASGTLPAGLSLNTATGAITGTPTAAGASSVTVTATNSIGTSAAATLSFTIAKASQTITFGALDAKTNLDAAFDLTATASSGLAVSYVSSNTSVATIAGATVTIVGIGSTNITASQVGNDNYNAATPVIQALTVGQYVAPTITITEITLPAFVATVGNTDHQTINVSGVNLTADVSLALSGANADQFSLSQATVAQSGGAAPNTVLTINYTPTTAGTHTATVTFSSAGAINVTRTLSGTASWITLTTPVATTATGVSTNGFTANWDAVEGATEYQLDAYYETAGGSGTTTVKSENFSGFVAGTTGATADGTDIAASIDTYAQSTGWTGLKVYQAGGAVKIGTSSILGNITTPAMDLSANSGSFSVSFKAMAWSGDSTRVKVYLNDVLVKTVGGLTNDANYTMNSFSTNLTGGTASSKLRFEGNQAAKGRFFIDDLVIAQVGGGITQTAVVGSPFTVTGATSKTLAGLGSATTYKYTVTAKNANSTSNKSNMITVATDPTGLINPEVLAVMSASNGSIKFTASAGETVEIYNAIGQKLLQQKTVEGTNTIQLRNQGVLLVKVGNKVGKVIL
jgi:hypothetical protein